MLSALIDVQFNKDGVSQKGIFAGGFTARLVAFKLKLRPQRSSAAG